MKRGLSVSVISAAICVELSLIYTALAQTPTSTPPDVRLLGGSGSLPVQAGRLEVLVSGQWYPVCGTGFTLASASVVCRSLGFSYAVSTSLGNAGYGLSNSSTWVQGVQCQGTESFLSQCSRSPLNSGTSCSHSLDVNVVCYPTSQSSTSLAVATTAAATSPGTQNTATTAAAAVAGQPSGVTSIPTLAGCVPSSNILLRDGANAAVGRVQVRLNNVWGTVCTSRGFGSNEAAVVCRQLCYDPAYAQAILPTNSTVFANSSVPIVIDSVQCSGNELALTSCTYSTANVGSCTHRSDAMVSCVSYSFGPPPAPVPNVTCTSVGAIVSFSVTGDTSQLAASDVALQQYSAPCSPIPAVYSSSIVLQFSYPGCMSASSSNSSHVIYSTTVVYNQRGVSNGLITRSTQYLIPVTCLLVRQSPVQSGINPQVQTAPPVSNVGTYTVSMVLYKDTAMQKPITNYPVNITLGDYLTVAVSLAADGSGLRLVLPYCYATPALNSGVTYVLLNQKCSIDPTVQIYSINQTTMAFRFQVFSFTTSTSVYINCDARVCAGTEVSADCDRTCYSRRRRQSGSYITYAVYQGPLVLQQAAVQQANGLSSSATLLVAQLLLLDAIATLHVFCFLLVC